MLHLVRSQSLVAERRRARQHGAGREFERLRDYRDGDERRDICWTATARRGKLVTRLYRPERSQTVWILLDGSRLLRARAGNRTKLDAAVDAALALAHVAQASGDRVGLVAYGRRVHARIAPDRGAAAPAPVARGAGAGAGRSGRRRSRRGGRRAAAARSSGAR